VVKFNNGLMAKADLFQADWADAQIVHSGVAGPATAIISSRPERRVASPGLPGLDAGSVVARPPGWADRAVQAIW